MRGIVEGAQPAVVKMSGTGGGIRSATNMVRYVSRDAAMVMERENGRQVTTIQQQNDMLEEWSHFFDKRRPSRDVVTLKVDINDSGISVKDVQNALESIYEKRRVVFGQYQDSRGNNQLIAVLTIASKGKGRIKTTDHALQQIATQLQKDHGIDTAGLNLSYGEVGHGEQAVRENFRQALAQCQELTGRQDKLITLENIDKIAKSWRRDLRSSGNRDIMHLIVSARASTEQTAFLKATRDLLAHEFANHKYAFALHGPHDQATDKRTGEKKATQHNHIHAMIVMRSISGDKLNPNIADFHRWRENMAYFARQHDINMVATRRSEHLNAPSYSKDEHELIKRGKASQHINDKVAAKRQNRKTMPEMPRGKKAAVAARQALARIARESKKNNDTETLEAIQKLMESYGKIAVESIHEAADLSVPPPSHQKQANAILQRYESAWVSVVNARNFYLRDGITEPMINAINNWADILISDINQDGSQQFRKQINQGITAYAKAHKDALAVLQINPADRAKFETKTKSKLQDVITAWQPRNTQQVEPQKKSISNEMRLAKGIRR